MTCLYLTILHWFTQEKYYPKNVVQSDVRYEIVEPKNCIKKM